MTYEKVCEKIDEKIDNIIDVCNNDPNNFYQLLNKIKNPNAMIELGYTLRYFENSNIILLLNEKISKIKPSMLSGFEITNYNSDDTDDTDDTDYYLNIVDKIKSNVNNYK